MDNIEVRTAVGDAIQEGEALLNRLRAIADQLDGDEVVEIRRQGPWRKGDVERLWAQVRHLSGVVALFEMSATRPGERVLFSELLERSGLDQLQQRNEHARLSRISREIFGRKRWPIENWQGPAEMIYVMPPRMAEWWREITEEPAAVR